MCVFTLVVLGEEVDGREAADTVLLGQWPVRSSIRINVGNDDVRLVLEVQGNCKEDKAK